MKILFTTWAWPSHYFPMVPLAWACRCAGHEVRVASQPALAEDIAASGLPAVLVGRDTDLAAMFRRDLTPLMRGQAGERDRTSRAFAIFAEVAGAMADDLVSFVLGWRPDIVVYDPITFAGPIAAAVAGVPAVRHLFGPDFTSRDGTAASAGPPDQAAIADLFARFGLARLDLAGALTVDPCPPALQVYPADPDGRRGGRRSMRYVPYNGPGAEPGWRLPQGRQVCLTWGTSTQRLTGQDGGLPAEVIKAASECGAGVVVAVTAAQRGALGDLPDGVRIAESVPLHLLLPQCAAVIHQGGAGTMLTAAACGLPQLIIPQLPDQAFNARQLAGTGAGRSLPRAGLSAGAARAELTALLDEPSHARSAARLRREITAQPSPADIVAVLEELAA